MFFAQFLKEFALSYWEISLGISSTHEPQFTLSVTWRR